jgi:hypothetical protein
MEWIEIDTGTRYRLLAANGESHAYEVFTDVNDAVHLTRWTHTGTPLPEDMSAFVLEFARQVARNAIVFPMGRGPGRPGMAPELDALVEAAKVFAERFEAGQDIDGYPHWQRERSAARFRLTGDANDCPSC